jgi:uncharacterized protein
VGGDHWDYTTWLNIIFLALAGVLVIRFARTGGGTTLKMMNGTPAPPDAGEDAGEGDGRPHPMPEI